jgi:hypothetical protein
MILYISGSCSKAKEIIDTKMLPTHTDEGLTVVC